MGVNGKLISNMYCTCTAIVALKIVRKNVVVSAQIVM